MCAIKILHLISGNTNGKDNLEVGMANEIALPKTNLSKLKI